MSETQGVVKLNIVVTEKGAVVVDGVAQKMTKLGTTADSTSVKLGGFAGGLMKVGTAALAAGAFLATAFVGANARLISTSSAVSDLSAKTGVATDTLQRLAAAGAPASVSMEAIAAAVDGMKRKMQDAPLAFNKIGLSIQELVKMDPGQAFMKVGEKIAAIENPTQKTLLALQLLGKSGLEVLPMLDKNMAAVVARAEELGLIMSKEVTAAADELGDKIGLLVQVFDSLWQNFAAGVVTNGQLHEAITQLTNLMGQLSQFVLANQKTISDWVTYGVLFAVEALKGLVTAVGVVRDIFDGLRLSFYFAKLGVMETVRAILEANVALATMASKIPGGGLLAKMFGAGDINKQIVDGKKLISDLGKEIGTTATKINGIVESNTNFHNGMAEVTVAIDKAGQAIKNAGPPVTDLGDRQKKTNTVLLESEAAAKKAEEAAKAYRTQVSDLARALKAAQGGQDRFSQAIVQAQNEAAKSREELAKKYEESAGRITSAENKAALEMVSTIERVQVSRARAEQFEERVAIEQARRHADEMARLEAEDRRRREMLATFDEIIGIVGLLGGNLGAAAGEAQAFGDSFERAAADGVLGWGEMLSLGKQAIDGFKKATDSASALGRAMGGAMMGGRVGASIGSLFGPGGALVGGIAGGIIGGIAGAFRKPGWAKVQDDVARDMGVKISKELAKAIEQNAKKLGIGRGDAALLSLGDIAKEGGKELRDMGGEINALLGKVARGAIPAKEGIAALADNFSQVADEAKKAGSIGDKTLVDMIRRSRSLGLEVPGIKEFVDEQLRAATDGLNKVIENLGEGAADQAVIFQDLFWGQVKEKGLVAAADAMRSMFETLKTNLAEAGGDEGILGPIQRIMDLTQESSGFRAGAEAADGLRQALEGLANSGYLTAGSFTAVQNQAQAAFDKMIAGGATSQEALMTIAPLLGSLRSAAQNYGIELDENTKALMAQAEAAGIAFKTDPMERMATALEAIAVKMGALPAAVDKVSTSFGNLGSMASSAASTAGESWARVWDPSGFQTNSFPHAATGIVVPPSRGGTPVVMGEGGSTEVAAPVGAMLREIGAGLRESMGNSGGFGGGPVTLEVDGEVLARVIEKRAKANGLRIPPEAVSDSGR